MESARWNEYFMDIALRTAKMSYCKLLQVGAVAVRNKRVICTGYNGTLPGDDNCCEHTVEVMDKNGHVSVKWDTKPEVEHAERNLITYAARIGISLEGSILYITHAPCVECARAICNVGFSRVYWNDLFKHNKGLEFLDTHNVPHEQLYRGDVK